MISAFVRVNENRKKLADDLEEKKLSEKQAFDISQQIVLDYQENQLAFNELMHYQDKGELLKKHPIFDEDNLKEEIDNMSDLNAFKLYKNMPSQISRLKKKLKANPLDEEAKRKLSQKESKRQLLQAKLNEK